MKKILIMALIIVIVIAVVLIINGIYCDNNIKVTNYNIKNTKSDVKLRFVIVSDLHNKEFGKDNKDLIELVKAQNPDFIAVCGDMVVRGNPDTSVMKSVLSQLKDIAPTYCCLGNHELDSAADIDFNAEINSTGAVLLDNQIIEFGKYNDTVIIGGLSDYPFYDFSAPDYNTPEHYCWDEINKKAENKFSILLHHQPEYIAGNAADSNIDIIACGHTHGGQIQIPFIGGLVAPNQGLFPKYDKGVYEFDSTKMIVCTGLGNNAIIPRINNQVEICVIDVS